MAEGAVVDALGYGTFAPDEVFAGAQLRPRASTLPRSPEDARSTEAYAKGGENRSRVNL